MRKTPNAVNSTSEYLKYRRVALRAMVPVKARASKHAIPVNKSNIVC